jgi:putative FmdB family regulatory protein
MPTYEYACDACGHRFEEFQSIKAKPIATCPVCKKKKVKRLISAGAGFIFKGSGFYITDYRSDSYKDAAKKDSSAASPSSDSKSEPAKANGSSTATPTATPAATPAPKSESKSSPKKHK